MTGRESEDTALEGPRGTAMGDPEEGGEMRARVSLTRHEFAHLWSGGVLSVKLSGRGVDVAVDLTYQEAPPTRGTRLLIKRVDLE